MPNQIQTITFDGKSPQVNRSELNDVADRDKFGDGKEPVVSEQMWSDGTQ